MILSLDKRVSSPENSSKIVKLPEMSEEWSITRLRSLKWHSMTWQATTHPKTLQKLADSTRKATECQNLWRSVRSSARAMSHRRRQPTPLPILPRNSQEIHLSAKKLKLCVKDRFRIYFLSLIELKRKIPRCFQSLIKWRKMKTSKVNKHPGDANSVHRFFSVLVDITNY